MLITSVANPKIKHIRKLFDKKYREAHQQYYLEGLRIVAEAIEQNAPLEAIIVCYDLLKSDFGVNLVRQQAEKGIELIEVGEEVFRKISQKDGPQGLAGIGKQVWGSLELEQAHDPKLWIALDRVQDPGNLGTILRTGDAVGCKGVILLEQCTDPYDLSSLRASMGAIFNTKLVKSNYAEFAEWVRQNDLPVVGTSDSAETDYQSIEYPAHVVILMGSEREGLKKEYYSLCWQVVRIPMIGKSDSLNLAVSTGIVLYEYFNQQRKKCA